MNEEEIALRLVEAWAGQRGLPVGMADIVEKYEMTLGEVKEIKKKGENNE